MKRGLFSVYLLLIFCFILPYYAFSQDIAIISSIPTDKEIDRIALAPNTGIAYGMNKEEKALYIFDIKTHTVKKNIKLNKQPLALAVNPQNNQAYLITKGHTNRHHNNKDTLNIIDSEGNTLNNIPIPQNSQAIAINPNNQTAVITINGQQDKLLIYSTETLETIKEIPFPHKPKLIALDTDTQRAVVTTKTHTWGWRHNKILVVDLNTGEILKQTNLKKDIRGLAIESKKDIAIAVSSEQINLIDINNGNIITTLQPENNQHNIKLKKGTPDKGEETQDNQQNDTETDEYIALDINQSTHTAAITGEEGFLLIDLNQNIIREYPLEEIEDLKTIAADKDQNTIITAYTTHKTNNKHKPTWWNKHQHGILQIQLPNPIPEITLITPDKIQRGTESQTLTITGDKYITTTQAYLNNQVLQTTFIDNNHLQAVIIKELMQTAGTFPITATNPIPDGGTSNQVFIQITNPVPTITNIDPQELTAGTTSQVLSITGTGFFEGMEVYLNGNKRNFTYIDPTKIQIELTQEELLAGGNLQITIKNPVTGGQTEPINIPINNPVPELIGLYPEQATSVELMLNPDLTLLGSNLVGTSKVIFNNVEYPVLYIDPNLITVFLPTEAIKTPGKYPVKIINPAPGGGESQTLEFTIQTPLNINITSPNNGEIINKQTATIKGVLISTNKDIGITVNGIAAAITGNEWVATNIPLTTGTNTIEAIIKDTTGRVATDQININTQTTTNKIQLKTNTTSGISPLQINFTAQAEIPEEQIIKYELDYEGDGFIDATGSIYDLTYDNISYTYTKEGNYNPTITILDDQGNTYTDTIVITVLSKTEMDTLLKSKWEAMKEALKNKDVDKAMEFFTADSRETYKEILSALRDRLPEIADTFIEFNITKIYEDIAECEIVANENGEHYSYSAILIKDESGIWKINDF